MNFLRAFAWFPSVWGHVGPSNEGVDQHAHSHLFDDGVEPHAHTHRHAEPLREHVHFHSHRVPHARSTAHDNLR